MSFSFDKKLDLLEDKSEHAITERETNAKEKPEMTNKEINKELKSLQNRLDELIDEMANNGAARDDVEDLIEALTKIRRARAKIED